MRLKPLVFLTLAVSTVLVSVPVFAHHGAAGYARDLTTLKGTVTEFRFVNPHSEILFDVTGKNGKTQKWLIELVSVASLSRYGWTKNTLKPGDPVSITGNAAKSGAYAMRLSKLVLPSGKVLSVERGEDYAEQ